MRKFLIAAALAASTLTAAGPAAAQYYPQGNGYGYPQGNAYGYNNYGQVRRLDARIDGLQRRINYLDQRNILSEREADRLRYESNQLERQLRYSARNGLSGWEAQNIERGIYRLEARLQREARDGNRWGNRPYGGYDRDRDGLDDRYERDHGTNYDEDHDRD
jgi:hypothetical protein